MWCGKWAHRLGASALAAALIGMPAAAPAEGQVQLRCDGTLLEVRGSAELKRTTSRLQLALMLEADGPTADVALAALQQRLARVRDGLRSLEVQQLRVGSPTTWRRAAERDRPAQVQAQLQLSGQLPPRQLQALIRQVGALPGVRLDPVTTQADPGGDAAARRQLLRAAFADARRQAEEIAAAAGLGSITSLEIRLEGLERPIALRAMAAAAPAPFDPAELPEPSDRLGMVVRFCAR